MRPHDNLSIDMRQLEQATLRHPLLADMSPINLNAEVRVLLFGQIFPIPSRKFRVGRESGTGDIVRHESRVGIDVSETDDVLVANDAAPSAVGEFDGGLDDPVVVGVVERVSSHLLTCQIEQDLGKEGAEEMRKGNAPALLILPSSYFRGYRSTWE